MSLKALSSSSECERIYGGGGGGGRVHQCQVSALMWNVCMDESTLKQIVQSTINPVTRCWDASGVC